MSESFFKKEVKNKISSVPNINFKVCDIETRKQSGIPDCFYAINTRPTSKNSEGQHGFIEYKYLPIYLDLAGKKLKLNHLTASQKIFLYKHHQISKRGMFMFLKIKSLFEYSLSYEKGNKLYEKNKLGSEYLLLAGNLIYNVNHLTLLELREQCCFHSQGFLDVSGLIYALSNF